MPKTYDEFMKDISADELYDRMIQYGMFAEKLPPVFDGASAKGQPRLLHRDGVGIRITGLQRGFDHVLVGVALVFPVIGRYLKHQSVGECLREQDHGESHHARGGVKG